MWSDGTIFLLQRRRRNVSEERSFLWNFQPISDEYSQPSPGSRLCSRDKKKLNLDILNICFYFVFSCASSSPSPQQQLFDQISSSLVLSASSCDGHGTFSLLLPMIWAYHQGEW